MAPLKLSKKQNPYASRGLDKFSSVLSELEARKKKIMSSASSNGISMVRFMYSNSRDWTPVIVRHREEEEDDDKNTEREASPAAAVAATAATAVVEGKKERMKWWRWRPSYYMLAVMLMILLCFVISGRGFAICCVSVGWYLLPVLKGEGSEESGNGGRKKRGGG